jgi:signal recognition particle subunit SRP54
MFEALSDRILGSIKKLKGETRVSEQNIEVALREIRMALLEADVHFQVVKLFLDRVKSRALGAEVLKHLTPGQHFVKVIHEELTHTLGRETAQLNVRGEPAIIMMVGLNGVGKTTTAAKLALYVRQHLKKKPGLVSVDVYRPAAREQLEILAKNSELPIFTTQESKPLKIATDALIWAKENMIEVLIVDTAGRFQIDEELMSEVKALHEVLSPIETLLVADAMLGQQSVNVAQGFNKDLKLTGLILTKLDGDARGGAALSIRETCGIPIKFTGHGEKISAIEVFHPERLASRILDMGDVLSLVEKAQEVMDETSAKDSMRRMSKNKFTMEDFLKQLQMLKKMGGMESLMGMIPGMGQMAKKMKSMAPPEKELKKIEAIIRSMTFSERNNYKILNGSRRLRIAKGSGTEVSDVNRFVKQFEESQKMMSQMMKMGLGGSGGPKFPFR